MIMATSRTGSPPSAYSGSHHSQCTYQAQQPLQQLSSHSTTKIQTPAFDKIDPLLNNLSPESTLEALSSTNAVPRTGKVAHDILSESITRVSPAERALCIRAAVAAQKLKSWYREVQLWPWPRGSDMHLGKGFIPPSHLCSPPVGDKKTPSLLTSPPRVSPEITYYGSLSENEVEQCERRIEEIRDGIDNLGVEDLKEHVLDAHIPYRSRPSSSASSASMPPPLSHVQLSDFTTVITATILRALPYLSRLNSLLSTWDVRLLVLRQVPGLLNGLRLTRLSLDSSFESLASTVPPTENDALYSRANFHAKQAELDAMAVSTGKMMDSVLDALEGREDSLPESWIDDLESIEADFSDWVVQAERRAVANEFSRLTVIADKSGTGSGSGFGTEAPLVLSNVPDNELGQPATPIGTSDSVRRSERYSPMHTIKEEEPGYNNPNPNSSSDLSDKPSVAADQVAKYTPEPNRVAPSCNPSVVLTEKSPAPSDAVESHTDDIPGKKQQQQPQSQQQQSCTEVTEDVVLPTSLEVRTTSSPYASDPETAKPILDPQADVQQEPVSTTVESETTGRDARAVTAESISGVEVSRREKPRQVNGDSDTVVDSCRYPASQTIGTTSPDSNIQQKSLRPAQPERVSISGAIGVKQKDDSKASIFQIPNAIPCEGDDNSSLKDKAEVKDSSVLSVDVPIKTTKKDVEKEDFWQTEPEAARSTSSPWISKPASLFDHRKETAGQVSTEHCSAKQGNANTNAPSSQQPKLDSPIKLSDTRARKTSLQESTAEPQRSNDSPPELPRLIPSPVTQDADIMKNGASVSLDTPPRPQSGHSHLYQQGHRTPPNHDHSLREHSLLNLENQELPPNMTQKHNRTVSLPLLRFINERLNMESGGESDFDIDDNTAIRRASGSGSFNDHQQSQLQSQTRNRGSSYDSNLARFNHNRDATITPLKARFTHDDIPVPGSEAGSEDHERNSHPGSPGYRPQLMNLASYLNNPLINKRLKPQPSLESLGLWKAEPEHKRRSSVDTQSQSTGSRSYMSKNPSKQQPKDRMDEKISSILSKIPARIRLASQSGHDLSDSPIISSLAQKARERQLSESPEGTPSRSSTPAPSLFLTPAEPRSRRQSYSQTPEDRSVRVYHLGDQRSKPSKLFVRSVGGSSERLMVRVGGGWADLGEYLREYAIHHGHRAGSEVPRIEAEGPSSPLDGSPDDRAFGSEGVLTRPLGVPRRPSSVLSSRPSSPLVVRKTRRASNFSDSSDLRTRADKRPSLSPVSSNNTHRRLSTSSNYSSGAAAASLPNNSPPNSPQSSSITTASRSASTPLGMAGPKPRSSRVSMTPESEAWVEDVLGQARKTSSTLKPPTTTNFGRRANPHPTITKMKSVSDIGSTGLSKRIALRGLNEKRV